MPLPGRDTPPVYFDLDQLGPVTEIRIPITPNLGAHPAVEFSDEIPPYQPYRLFVFETIINGHEIFMEARTP